jgi:hypothetical protein
MRSVSLPSAWGTKICSGTKQDQNAGKYGQPLRTYLKRSGELCDILTPATDPDVRDFNLSWSPILKSSTYSWLVSTREMMVPRTLLLLRRPLTLSPVTLCLSLSQVDRFPALQNETLLQLVNVFCAKPVYGSLRVNLQIARIFSLFTDIMQVTRKNGRCQWKMRSNVCTAVIGSS